MNKHKFKLLFALFSFLVGAIFVACNYDDSSREYHDENGNKAHFKKEKVSFEIFSKNKKLFSKLNTDKETLTAKATNKIVSASDNSFFINTNSATYIENDNGLHSYTFFINRNLENILLENLVISLQEDGTYKSFIVTYNITYPELQNLKNGIFVDMNDRMSIEVFNDDNFMSQLSNKVVYSQCITGSTEYWRCSNGNQHSPGDPGPPICVADSFEYVINVEYGLCASDEEGVPGGDSGSSDGGGSGGGSTDSNDTTYDGSDTSIHGGGVSTAPTIEDDLSQNPPTPCKQLKDMVSKTVVVLPNNNTQTVLQNLNDLVNNMSTPRERGYLMEPDSSQTLLIEHYYDGPMNGDEVTLTYPSNMAIDIIMHCHYSTNQLPVFSLSDLYQIYVSMTTGNIYSPTTFTSVLVTAHGTRYALKITNSTAFANWGSTFFSGWDLPLPPENNPMIKLSEDKFGKYVNNNFQLLKNENGLASFLQNIGVELYSADSSFSQWSKVTSNSNGIATKTTCP